MSIHTRLKEKSQEISANNSGCIFLKSYLSHNHPITHFLSVRNFSGTFWKPWHLLTGTGLQTKKRQVSQVKQPLRAMPQLIKVSPKQSKGTQTVQEGSLQKAETKCSGQTWELRAMMLKFNFWRPATILVWISRNFPKLQSFFYLFQCYLKNTYYGLSTQNAVKKTWSLTQGAYNQSSRDTGKYT